MNHYLKLSTLIFFVFLLVGCHNINVENENAKNINVAFVKGIEIPILDNADTFYRTFSIEDKLLTYSITTTDYSSCLEFLTFNINPNNIYWDSINLHKDGWNTELANITLLKEQFKSYVPDKYCDNNSVTFTLKLDSNNSHIEFVKQEYLAADEAILFQIVENEELKYISSLYSMFDTNRDVIIREESIGGREIFVEYRNERNTEKEDRIRLNISYKDTSRYFCEQVIQLFVSNIYNYITNEHNQIVDNFMFGSYTWETFWLNGEKLTYNFKYDAQMICHTNNDIQFVFYNEYNEGLSFFGDQKNNEEN